MYAKGHVDSDSDSQVSLGEDGQVKPAQKQLGAIDIINT